MEVEKGSNDSGNQRQKDWRKRRKATIAETKDGENGGKDGKYRQRGPNTERMEERMGNIDIGSQRQRERWKRKGTTTAEAKDRENGEKERNNVSGDQRQKE